jgi:glycosyltransferase involved in cell wall biosynthesis
VTAQRSERQPPHRVAWLLYGSLEQRTGGTIYDARIVDGLRSSGVDVEVLSITHDTGHASEAPRLVRELARSRPDVLVGDELCFRELGIVFSRARFTRRVLLVHHFTCWEEELAPAARRRARRWEATTLRHADAVIATSEATRDRLALEGHRRPISVVRPGADRLPRLPRAHSDGPVTFLFVGAIISRKRVRELVQAFASVPPPARLRLAGSERDAVYRRALGRALDELGLGERVTFLGEVDEAALARELAAADALVMPSSLEGYGIAATEAIHAGTPVIAARTPGLEEALRPCPDGAILVENGAALVKAMTDVAMIEPWRRSMQVAASEGRMPAWSEAAAAFRAALGSAAGECHGR